MPRQYKAVVGPSFQNDQAPFQPNMVQGSRPESPRLFTTRNQLGTIVAPVVNIAAPISPEMMQGYHPDKPLPFSANHLPSLFQFVQTTSPFSMDELYADRPISPRLFNVLNHLGAQLSQTTVPVINSPEMYVGALPPQKRKMFGPFPTGNLAGQITPVIAFSVEMTQGSAPPVQRYPLLSGLSNQSLEVASGAFLDVSDEGGGSGGGGGANNWELAWYNLNRRRNK